jgi:hypothetical protein
LIICAEYPGKSTTLFHLQNISIHKVTNSDIINIFINIIWNSGDLFIGVGGMIQWKGGKMGEEGGKDGSGVSLGWKWCLKHINHATQCQWYTDTFQLQNDNIKLTMTNFLISYSE